MGVVVRRPRRWGVAAADSPRRSTLSSTPLGHPVVIGLTAAQCADGPQLPGPIAGVETEAVLADKGYDSESNRAAIRGQGAEPYIPEKKNRKETIEYEWHLYRERNVVERFSAPIRQYRHVATRYDKKAKNFLGFVRVASLGILLA